MSTEVAGTATYHATVTFPDDGDPRNATTLGAALEDLTDRTAALHDRPSGDTSSIDAGATENVSGTIAVLDDGCITLGNGAQLNALTGSLITHSTGAQESHATGSLDEYLEGSTVTYQGLFQLGAKCTSTEAPGATVAEGAEYTQTGRRSLSGSGRISERVAVGVNADGDYSASVADVVVLTAGVLNADHVYTLVVGAATKHGDRITFVSYDTNYGITFTSSATIFRGVELTSGFHLQDESGGCSWVEFMFSDGTSPYPAAGWYVVGYRRVP